jgi:hypothetical protein
VSAVEFPSVIDQLDAVEVAEMCGLLAQWLTGAGPAVQASLDAHLGTAGFWTEVRDGLAAWSQRLLELEPLT